MTELTAESIACALSTRRLGRPALVFDRIGSTNDVARQRAEEGAGDGLLVIAEEQTAGRGRLERRWWAPPGTCLLMSLLLAPATTGRSVPLHRAGQLTMCLGLGAVEGIAEVTGLAARLKWPNDVLIRGRKLGGMLTELNTDDGQLKYAVVGLGLNVNLDFTAEGTPPELLAAAASLGQEAGRSVPRLPLLASILAHTEHWYDRVLAGESPHAAWAQHLDTLDQRVRVTLVSETIEGVATGVSPEGALLVGDDSGTTHTIWSGDVITVR